jgi:surface antigen
MGAIFGQGHRLFLARNGRSKLEPTIGFGITACSRAAKATLRGVRIMKKLFPVILVLSTAGLFTPGACAANLGFLKGAAVEQFNDADWKMLDHAVDDALNNQPDGKGVTWKNEETGHWGTVTPLTTMQKHGLKCRKVRFENTAGKRTGQATFTYCDKDGVWKLAE